ncbi:acetoin utilization protein AcuC [Williamsia deligens]|uniref:Acetoin utilization protein AcuC n=1 Tax=Williamsia deligens TaxID=321325 RepID=A0ABW3GCD5_9NOCA|nr:acetoin utilization protein AcuC [Williamsia deligens]MCP2195411.1 acetoin utilization protein AcuC [Williamsia deligens]
MTTGADARPVPGSRSSDTLVVWGEELLGYRWSPSHPMNPVRLALTVGLARGLGILDGVETLAPTVADDPLLHLVHRSEYIAAVRDAGAAAAGDPPPGWSRQVAERIFGLGTDDNPIFGSMHEAAALIVGGTVAAADAIARGAARRAVNIGGGMHHAFAGRASGFCIYNDCAVAIARLLDAGFDRIAYVDIDAHHGDGVQRRFAADPRVLTVSVHQHPATLFPGTGYPEEVGEGAASGTSVNLALPPGTPDRLWLRAFHAVVPSVVADFGPQVIVSQCGVDSHRADPLTDLHLTVDGQRAAMQAMRDLADEHCDGRWLAVGGGGYGVVDVVPRSWTHLLAVALDRDLDPATPTPEPWRESAAVAAATVAADFATDVAVDTMGDGGSVDFDRWEGNWGQQPPDGIPAHLHQATDAAILATRSAVFPLRGLDAGDPRD